MSPDVTNPRRTLAYSSSRFLLSAVWLPLWMVLICLLILRFGEPKLAFPGVLGIVACLVWIGYIAKEVWLTSSASLVLSTEGLRYRAVSGTVVPWREVRQIEVLDHTFSHGRSKVTLASGTVVFVSRAFYDRALHIASFFARGPLWSDKFVDRGDLRGIVIAPEFFSIPPDELHQAISVRWKAFRGGSEWSLSDMPVTGTGVASPAPRGGTSLMTPWETIKLALPLAGILVVLANFAGLWETTYQRQRRETRERYEAEERKRQEERKADQDKWDKVWRDFDRSMRRLEPDPTPPRR